jgi:hypothetical protein
MGRFECSPDLHVEVLTRFRVGRWVIHEHRLTRANVEPRPLEHLADIFQLIGGKIVRVLILTWRYPCGMSNIS